ncbi:MAG: hypothetical protein AB4290_07845 [Spirulina sp.]
MTATALVHKLNTGDIEVMSNVTDLTVRGDRVSRLDSDRASATVHLSFTVQNPQKLASILDATDELGFILRPEDAIEVGLSLVAMGMQGKTPEEITAALRQCMAEL